MSGRNREPVAVIIAKGKTHLTKEEISKRKSEELQIPVIEYADPPNGLNAKQKKKYKEIADKLITIGIFTDLDVDCLTRYVISEFLYMKYTSEMTKLMNSKDKVKDWSVIRGIDDDDLKELIEKLLKRQHGYEVEALQRQQDKAFKQCQSCAQALGLTITSRARLIIPDAPDNDEEL